MPTSHMPWRDIQTCMQYRNGRCLLPYGEEIAQLLQLEDFQDLLHTTHRELRQLEVRVVKGSRFSEIQTLVVRPEVGSGNLVAETFR